MPQSVARRDPRTQSWVALVADLVILSITTVVAFVARGAIPSLDGIEGLSANVDLVGAAMGVLWLLSLAAFGAYRRTNLGAGALEYQRVVMASAMAAGLTGIACYLLRFQLSRSYFLLVFGIGTPLLLFARYAVRRVVHRLNRAGSLGLNVLLAGPPARVDELAHVLRREAWLGYRVVGAIAARSTDAPRSPGGIPIVGDTRQALTAIEAVGPDAVIFTDGSFDTSADFRRMAWALERHDVQMIVVPGLTDVSAQRVHFRPVAGLPLVHVERPQSQAAGTLLKRTFDIAVASMLVLLLAVPVLIIAALIKLSDRGPVFFRQTRVGRDGAAFQCIKLRSMVVDAEHRLTSLTADGQRSVLFKMAADPRITRIGAVIRRYSIDETPQLLNVLRGEMSLVGPRPPLPAEVARYGADVHRRLAVRPGMTGLWQVSGRSNLSWDDTVRLDLYYVDNWSMMQDLSILIKTFRAVVTPVGAY